MLTPHDAMRIAEDAGISGLVRYNWNKEIVKAIDRAFALGAAQGIKQEPKSEFQRGYDLAISTTKQHVRHLNDELARWQEQHSQMLKQGPVYWDVIYDGNHVRNIHSSKGEAESAMHLLNAKHEGEREVVPLYTSPQAREIGAKA